MARKGARRFQASRPGLEPGRDESAVRRRHLIIGMGIAGVTVLIVVVAVLGLGQNGGNRGRQSTLPVTGVTVQGTGGTWTNITPDQLATMLASSPRQFTLVNVKTPYVGEIDGTDLYIPYDQLPARASELPADRSTAIAVYCRSGHESAIAAQTLIDLGYRNILNLDGGMTAWTASGRQLVQRQRT